MEDDDNILYHMPHVNEDVKNNLLFIHMTVAQKLLLQHYNNLVLMDATYHTCRLMLPVFFLDVKTNVVPLLVSLYRMKMQGPYQKCYLGLNNTSTKME